MSSALNFTAISGCGANGFNKSLKSQFRCQSKFSDTLFVSQQGFFGERTLPMKLSTDSQNARRKNFRIRALSLPAGNWSSRSVKAYSLAELEAKKLKYPSTGTEALLMGILVEGIGEGSKFLRENGVGYFTLRYETLKLLGKADMFYFADIRPPATQPLLKALDWALEEHKKLGLEGEVTSEWIILGIWEQKESAGRALLEKFGLDQEKISALYKKISQVEAVA